MYLRHLLLILLVLPACRHTGEPVPVSNVAVKKTGAHSKVQALEFNIEGPHSELFKEVFDAENESRMIVFNSEAKRSLNLKINQYEFEQEDDIDLIPGALFPGFVPFGPVGIWWALKDNRYKTPIMRAHLQARLSDKEDPEMQSDLVVNVEVIRGISKEEDLARASFSLMSREVLNWIENKS